MPINNDGIQPPLKIGVQSLNDFQKGKPIWVDGVILDYLIKGNKPRILDFGYVQILEDGMKSGATAVGFWLIDDQGNRYFAELSAALLDMLHGAVQGSEQRFAQEQIEARRNN